MISSETILSTAKKTILAESDAIKNLVTLLNDDFVAVVNLIYQSKGRIIVTGIGKSAIIAQKIVATFNSTGTPALFLHAAEAIHGDLGMVQTDDIVICVSKSGTSAEIKSLVPLLQRATKNLVAITGTMTSYLANEATFVLNTTVEKEACYLNLAPTSSTTAQLVMGDALAVCLMEMRGFTANDFAKYHPGGALGKKLLFTVKDIMDANLKPSVEENTPIKKVIFEISEKRLGVTAVVEKDKIVGIITDGDIRRMLNNRDTIAEVIASDIMSKNPKTIEATTLVIEALQILEHNAITQLIVVDKQKYVGVLHLHDILKEGIL